MPHFVTKIFIFSPKRRFLTVSAIEKSRFFFITPYCYPPNGVLPLSSPYPPLVHPLSTPHPNPMQPDSDPNAALKHPLPQHNHNVSVR